MHIMEKFPAKFHDMGIPSYTMENSFECIHDIGTFSYTMDYSLTGIHEIKTFSYIMEKFLRGIHDMENSAYVMEKVFLAACFCLSPAVLSTESAFSTAPTEDREQYSANNYCSVLLPLLVISSTINRIRIQYCSDSPHGAVVTKESAFSTAPTAGREQYSTNNYGSVLLRQPPWSSSNKEFSIQYCSDNPQGAVVTKESAFSTAPTAGREQYSANNYGSVLLRQPHMEQ